MEQSFSMNVHNSNRKSSMATIVVPNTADSNTTTKTDPSQAPLTVNNMSIIEQNTSSFIQIVKEKLGLQNQQRNSRQQDDDMSYMKRKDLLTQKGKEKQQHDLNDEGSFSYPSYRDPRLSQAVVVEKEPHQKKRFIDEVLPVIKKIPRRWIAAFLMVVLGIFIAITFILVGLSKATAVSGNNNNSTESTANSTSRVSAAATASLTSSSYVALTSIVTLTVTQATAISTSFTGQRLIPTSTARRATWNH
ncbi:MAG: hypothetical protein EXX96DRAFT_77164 [Benjaminiella poitrasii]|nr:MAG: hypothetical protein EXX96DRAFT_77164 [Benjaminiella poitrasii]